MFWKKDKSIRMSLPKEKEVHGVRIIKLPVARYIAALNTVENLPHILVSELIPEAGGIEDLLTRLRGADSKAFELIITKLLTKIPTEVCTLISELLGIPRERLLDPECPAALSLNELVEILIEFWKMNDMNDFFGNVRRFVELTARRTQANSGFSGGLP